MGLDVVIENFTADKLDKQALKALIENKKSFAVARINDISILVDRVEEEIESQGLSCRVYTEYRSAAIAGALIPTGATQIAGLATAVGIGLHNLFTMNPDYEIAKNPVTSTITVTYKKDAY